MTRNIPLCVNCKHMVRNDTDWQTEPYKTRYAICGLTSRVHPLDGIRCSDRRDRRTGIFGDACGNDGALWEPKA